MINTYAVPHTFGPFRKDTFLYRYSSNQFIYNLNSVDDVSDNTTNVIISEEYLLKQPYYFRPVNEVLKLKDLVIPDDAKTIQIIYLNNIDNVLGVQLVQI